MTVDIPCILVQAGFVSARKLVFYLFTQGSTTMKLYCYNHTLGYP